MTTTTEPITLTLQTRTVRNETVELYHKLDIRIDDDVVIITLAGYGPGCADHPPISSTDPAVVRFFREIDAALQATAYANRPA